MTDIRPNLATLLPELYKDEHRSHPAPTLEEILDYADGNLPPEEEEQIQERLAFHPEATQMLLDVQDPSRLEDRFDDEDLPSPDRGTLRERLREEGLFEPPARVVPFRRGVHPFYRWAAAALFVLSAGLALQLLRRPADVPAEAGAVDVLELLPRDESRERGAGELVEALPGVSQDLLLYAPDLAPGDRCRLAVIDDEGAEALVRDTWATRAGRVVLRLAPGELAAGRYEVLLSRAGETLAVYDLDWRRP